MEPGTKVRIKNTILEARSPNTGKIIFKSLDKSYTGEDLYWIKFDDGVQFTVRESLIMKLEG